MSLTGAALGLTGGGGGEAFAGTGAAVALRGGGGGFDGEAFALAGGGGLGLAGAALGGGDLPAGGGAMALLHTGASARGDVCAGTEPLEIPTCAQGMQARASMLSSLTMQSRLLCLASGTPFQNVEHKARDIRPKYTRWTTVMTAKHYYLPQEPYHRVLQFCYYPYNITAATRRLSLSKCMAQSQQMHYALCTRGILTQCRDEQSKWTA